MDNRAQLPLSLLEVAIGVVLVLSIVVTISFGVAQPDTQAPQLDRYADDAVTLLANEPPEHAGATRLAEMLATPEAFGRERETLNRRLDRILPDNLLYRLETAHGTVGYPLPEDVTTGRATMTTASGAVTLMVWYA